MAPGALLEVVDETNMPNAVKSCSTESGSVQYILSRNIHSKPLKVIKMEGNRITVNDGKKTWLILDAAGGAAVACIGYGDPSSDGRIKAAVIRQFDQGILYAASLDFTTDPAEELARFLIESTSHRMSKVVFYSGGSEANDAAIKLCFQYHSKEKANPESTRTIFIARERSYHGATLGPLNLSGHNGRRDPFKPILPRNTVFISACNPYRDMVDGQTEEEYVEQLRDELDRTIREHGPRNIAGFWAEPVVGAALGCMPAPAGYFRAMKAVCDKYGVIFVADEVMCGMGRTGYLHAWEREGIVPHIQLLGKGLSGGFAQLSAMLVGPKIIQAFENGSGNGAFNHGHTFQNSPLACAAALEVQKYIAEHNLVKRVHTKGPELKKKLEGRLRNHPHVGDVRGPGFYFCGIEFVQDKTTKQPFPASDCIAWRLHEMGLTENYGIYVYAGTGSAGKDKGDHIEIHPAYNTTDEELDMMVDRLVRLINDFFEKYTSTSACTDRSAN